MNPYRLRAYFLLILTALIWGVAGSVIKYTLDGIDPLSFLAYRFAISGALGVLFFLFFPVNFPKGLKNWIVILIYCLFSTTFGLATLFLGLEETTVLNLSLVTLSLPLLTSFAGVFFLNDRITKKEWLGSTIALAGTAITVAEPILENTGMMSTLRGNILILGYIFFEITSVIILKKLLQKNTSPIALSHLSFIVAFVSFLPVIIFNLGAGNFVQKVTSLPVNFQLGVWYMAIFSGTIAYTFRAKAQKSIEVSEAALFHYLTPLFGVPIAIIWLGEKITPLFIIGASIIAVGVFVAEYRKRQ